MTIYYVNAKHDGTWKSCGGYTDKELAEMMVDSLESVGIVAKIKEEED